MNQLKIKLKSGKIEIGKCVKVFAPATIANLVCGFDVLGMALNDPAM